MLLEKIPSGEEPIRALRAVEEALGRKASATMPTEVGGINSTIPLFVGARLGLPLVDADGQGRAFPELQMETFAIEGVAGTPMGIEDEKSDCATIRSDDHHRIERIARGITIRMGGTACFVNYPMSGAEVKRASVKRALSLARQIGRIIRTSRRNKLDPFEELETLIAMTDYGRAKRIFSGKVTDLDRQTKQGFTLGSVTITSDDGTGAPCVISFQNENLCA